MRLLNGMAVMFAVSGCHLVNGFDDLTLRDGAKHTWSFHYGDELPQTIDDVVLTPTHVRVAGQLQGEIELGDERLGSDEPTRFLAQLDGQGVHDWSLALPPAVSHHGLMDGTTRLTISHAEPVTIAGLQLDVVSDVAFEVIDIDADGAGAEMVIGGSAQVLDSVHVVQQPDTPQNLLFGATFDGRIELAGCESVMADDQNVVVARVENRECVWMRSFGDGQEQWIDGVAAQSSGEVIVAGRFKGEIEFDKKLVALGGTDYFLVKLDLDGVPLWSHRYGDLDRDQHPMRLAVRPSGTISIAGYYAGNVDFGLGADPSSLGHDIFVAKLDPSGNTVWAKHFDVRNDAPADIEMADQVLTDLSLVVDRPGNTILGGHFRGNVDFGGTLRSSDGDLDMFLFKLDVDGLLHWSDTFGDNDDQCAFVDCTTDLAVDGSDNIILGGGFAGGMNLGGDDLDSAGDSDAFLAKFER